MRMQSAYRTKVNDATASRNTTTEVHESSTTTRLINGSTYVHIERGCGWACTRRLPTEHKTKEQLRFIFECYEVGVTNKAMKISPTEAHELMKIVGTKEGERRLPNNEYFKAKDDLAPIFSRADVLDEHTIKPYFGKNRLELQKMTENLDNKELKKIANTVKALSDYTTKWGTTKQITIANMKILLAHIQVTHDIITSQNKDAVILQFEDALRRRSMFTKVALEMESVRLQLLLPLPPTPPVEQPVEQPVAITAPAGDVINVAASGGALSYVRATLTEAQQEEEEEGNEAGEDGEDGEDDVSNGTMRYM